MLDMTTMEILLDRDAENRETVLTKPEGNREIYSNLLKRNICRVVFEKVNGEMRDMVCTLLADFLPEQTGDSKSKRLAREDSISVWDINANNWRSFKVANVKHFAIKDA